MGTSRILAVLIFLFYFYQLSSQHIDCDSNICPKKPIEWVCANDGYSYTDRCFVETCAKMTVVHEGMCESEEDPRSPKFTGHPGSKNKTAASTTASPTTLTTGPPKNVSTTASPTTTGAPSNTTTIAPRVLSTVAPANGTEGAKKKGISKPQ